MTSKCDIVSMNFAELSRLVAEFGEPDYRAKQIFSRLQSGIGSFDEITNIPKIFREKLSEKCYIARCKIKRRFESKLDDTVKYLFELNDGEFIESVLMRYRHGYTACISTQVGCNMGCKFCASGLYGKTRDLTASEMISQITAIQADKNVRISNIVLMGMGEPLDNFDNTARFLKLVSNDEGLNIGLRHISVSTCGVVSGIEKLAALNMPVTLSVSLHAPFDSIRDTIMPINKKWSITELIAACKKYQSVTTRRISFEYALISGVNDSDACAKELARILKGIMCHINLIPANPVNENSFLRPDKNRISEFKNLLTSYGMTATVRRTLGADIDASCGQLRRQLRKETNGATIQ
ncbi:MAG: 23S rRNA (adenine(2503)-C(2))-methyltransferase RlmN [Clostridia bacterium]|nr:23S rRNA (adenine(2503)-C(2))-methyltransferase RlmN [Clostridia bacterium]